MKNRQENQRQLVNLGQSIVNRRKDSFSQATNKHDNVQLIEGKQGNQNYPYIGNKQDSQAISSPTNNIHEQNSQHNQDNSNYASVFQQNSSNLSGSNQNNTSFIVQLPFIKNSKESQQQSNYKKQHSIFGSNTGFQSVVVPSGVSNNLDMQKKGRLTHEITSSVDIEKKIQKSMQQSENNFQKIKMKNKSNNTQRQQIQAAIFDKSIENQTLLRNERFINNLHNNLTINGQKQDLLQNQSPEIALQQNQLKKKYIRGITKSQDPSIIMTQNTNTEISTHRDQQQYSQFNASMQQQQQQIQDGINNNSSNIVTQPIVKSQYNHQFSNIKGTAKITLVSGQDSDTRTQQTKTSYKTGTVPFLDRRDTLRNQFIFGSEVKNPTLMYSDDSHHYETSIQTPKNNNRESTQQNSYRQSPYENLIQQSNVIITDKANTTTNNNGLSFISPSLDYKKKKRDYFPQSSTTGGMNKNHHLQSSINSQAQQHYMSLAKANQIISIASDNKNQQKKSIGGGSITSANSNINQLIHQLNMNRIGNPHLSFAQVLRNMNNKVNYNQVPVTNIDTIENIKKDFKTSKDQNFSILIRSGSQDFEALTASNNEDFKAEINQKLLSQNKLNQKKPSVIQEELKTQERNFIQIKKNANNLNDLAVQSQNYNHIEKKSRILNADELYDMAKKLKKQNRLKQGIVDSQKNLNRSTESIQQQNLLGYMSVQNDQNRAHDIPGALNISKIQGRQKKADVDIYQMKQKDMQLIYKYSKKSQNLLQSYEEYVQQNFASQINNTSRNQRSQLDSSKSQSKDFHKSNQTKVNQSADFSVTGVASQGISTIHLLKIQEIQPQMRSEDKREPKPQNLIIDDQDQDSKTDQQQQDTQEESKETLNIGVQQMQIQQYSSKQMRNIQAIKSKQQQNQKTFDIDKILYGNQWDKEAAKASNKKKIEIQFHDVGNDEFQNHQINKTIKQMSLMSNLMFRTKEYGNLQYDILNRCSRYFGIPIPKPYKNDIVSLMKNKEFLTLAKEKMHLMLFNHINKTNQIESQNQPTQPKYIIGNGNNHMLVKSVFKTRQWWILSEKENFEECNFIWTQWLKERHLQSLPTIAKKNQISNNQDPQEENIHIMRIYNKIHNNHNLSDKKHLFHNMKEYYLAKNIDPFKILPLTYVIENGLNDVEFDKFEQQFHVFAQQEGVENIWIIKPGEDTNRGSGIIVSKDFSEIKQLVRDKASRGVDKTAILQKYIENPLLINKRKFDIRCYGLLTSINGNLMGFFYQDGYLRTSCKEFSVQNLNNKFIHLTNDAIQKYSDDYGKFENANKLSYQDFDKYFENNGDFDLRFNRDFLPQIRGVIRDSFNAVASKIDVERRLNTFELFGYDFMITDDFELKLIEANTNPSIEICCPLLARIIPNLIDSAFKIAIDPLFPPPSNKKNSSAWGSGNEILNEIKFELVFQNTQQ
eukprot:403330922